MNNDIIIGIDLAKNVFQLHGARRDGAVLFRKKLTRPQLKKFMSAHEPCLVAMEACGTSHYWARELSKVGHNVKLIPPIYVNPFVKRHKNDAADAEAITEAALRPNMSFVEPKSADTQAKTMMMRTRAQLIGQRTATVNALRSHLAEFGLIVPVGLKNVDQLRKRIEETEDIPTLVTEMVDMHFAQICNLSENIEALNAKIKTHCTLSVSARLLQTMPGIGAMVIEAFAPDMQSFARGRDFAAWLGLIPRQNSSGGKTRLGRTTKMGQKDIRHALITGAMSCIASASRHGKRCHPWLQDKLDRKPKMVAAIALANKMARAIWAMLTKSEAYKAPIAVSAQ